MIYPPANWQENLSHPVTQRKVKPITLIDTGSTAHAITNTIAGIYLHPPDDRQRLGVLPPGRAYVGGTMSGDVAVLITALGVLFIALVAACAVAYGFWRGNL